MDTRTSNIYIWDSNGDRRDTWGNLPMAYVDQVRRQPAEEQAQVQAEHMCSDNPLVSTDESAPHPDTSLRKQLSSQTLDPDDPAPELVPTCQSTEAEVSSEPAQVLQRSMRTWKPTYRFQF